MTLVPMRPGPLGRIALNEELERRLNPGDPPVVLARSGLRVGSRIVQTKNDSAADREVMNGGVAFVLEWDDEEGEVRLSLDEGEREIVTPVFALETYNLAWALTTHRSRDRSFQRSLLPGRRRIRTCFRGRSSTPRSRVARRLCVLVGERRAVSVVLGRVQQRRRHSVSSTASSLRRCRAQRGVRVSLHPCFTPCPSVAPARSCLVLETVSVGTVPLF